MSDFYGDIPHPEAFPGPDRSPPPQPPDVVVVRPVPPDAASTEPLEQSIIARPDRRPFQAIAEGAANSAATEPPEHSPESGTTVNREPPPEAGPPAIPAGGGGDRPPDPPDIAAASPEGEPPDFGVQRFDTEQPAAAELPHIAAAHNHLIRETLTRFEQYTDVIAVDDFVASNTPLQSQSPGGMVYLTPRSTGVITAIFLRPSGTHTYHEYYLDQDGALRRDDIDLDLQLSGFPLPGELPTREVWERHRRQAASEHENRVLERGWGLNGHLVGPQQQEYLATLLSTAAPKAVSFAELNDIAVNRLRSDRPPSTTDSQWAAGEFTDSIRAFLEDRGHILDEAIDTTERLHGGDSRGGFLQVWSGQRRNEAGRQTPFVHIHSLKEMDKDEIRYLFGDRFPDVSAGKLLIRIGYAVGEEGLSCTRYGRFLDAHDVPLLVTSPESAKADVLEARKVRNFLAGTSDW